MDKETALKLIRGVSDFWSFDVWLNLDGTYTADELEAFAWLMRNESALLTDLSNEQQVDRTGIPYKKMNEEPQ